MRPLLYFLLGFALQFVFLIPANAGWVIKPIPYSSTYDKINYDQYGLVEDCATAAAILGRGDQSFRYSSFLPYAWYSYNCSYVDDSASNGIQDGDETGIDCGGSTGVDCVVTCPDGYIPYGENSCVATAPNPYPAGTPYPTGEISDGEPWVKPGQQAQQLHHSPDYTPTPDDWTYGTFIHVNGDTTTYNKYGDYVIRDENGNIIEAQIIGDYVSHADNDDGTTTTVTQDKVYKDGETTVTSTTTTVTDNATGEVITQYTSDTKTTGSLIAAGKGSDANLTGNQYAAGVTAIIGAITGDSDGDDPSWSDPGDPGVVDYEGNALDESEYDWRSYIDNYINDNSNFGWLSVIADSSIQTSNPHCSITGDVSIGSTTIPVTLSLCEYESTFETMGAWLALLCQLTALIITFGGLD